MNVTDVFTAIRERHSARTAFDPVRTIRADELDRILEAARWAPTAHNMQNFELVVVDHPGALAELGAIEWPVSEVFVQENYRQLAFTREQLAARKTGLLAEGFPPAWRDPAATPADLAAAGPAHLRDAIHGAPTVVIAIHDPRERAPASEGDVLGMMSLGCVLENMWLAAQAQHLGFQVMSVVSDAHVAPQVKRVLGIPELLAIGFGVRLGVPLHPPDPLRVRREVAAFVHRNRFRR